MSLYNETELALAPVNTGLKALYEEDRPLTLDFHGRPHLDVRSFESLIYKRYGRFRNASPVVAGSLAVRGFITEPRPNNRAMIYAGVESDYSGYGFLLNPAKASHMQFLNGIARAFGVELNAR